MGYSVHSSLQHVQSCYCGLSCCLCQGRSSSSLWSLRLCWLCCPIHLRLCWISICLLCLAGYGTTNGANTVGINGLAAAAVPAVAGGYAAAGRYVANSAGVVHVAKREAEADADADALYGYYGYARPYAYGLGYRSYGYGYPYAYYGKRSADAEPE